MPKYAAKVDSNQSEIVEALKRAGASVQHLHTVGMGCPDICVGYRGVNLMVEIKDGSKPPSRRRLTPPERYWHEAWRGQVCTVENVDQALNLIGHVQIKGVINA